jgi:FkbM family methyltransferase
VLRKVLGLLSRGVILERHLPADFGSIPIFVTPDAALGFWNKDLERFDPFLFHFARKLVQPDFVVWDIGANVGLFTFAAASRVGEQGSVLAIEPDPFLGGLIQRSIEKNGYAGRVRLRSQPISDLGGTVLTFNISKRGRCANYVSGFGTGEATGSRKSITIASVTLDGLLAEGWPIPQLVKIDIEGMDHLALRGAEQVLGKKPILILEATDANREEIGEILRRHGYRLYDTDLHPVQKMPLCNLAAMAE